MPRSKNPETFGPEYEQLLLTMGQKSSLRIDLPTSSTCHTMRRKYYSYVEALRQSGRRPDLLQIANAVSVTVNESEGAVEGHPLHYLWFFRTEDAWDNTAIRQALGLEKGFAESGGAEVRGPVTAQDDLKAKLAEIRGRK